MYEKLMEEVVTDGNCALALAAVKRNKGAAGIDRMTTKELENHLQAHGERIRAKLLAGTYVPSPVRRVEIPKPSGGTRMPGIPTVQDRLIQQMMLQVPTPIFDPQFSEHNYGFLEYLETTRGNSAETRNIRLAAIRSFFRFLQHREPAAIEQVRRVLAFPFKKTDTRLVSHLVQEEMQALLDAPDPSTRAGVRDRAMLHLAVCAGLRVSELTGLRVEDVAPQSASIRIRGKGRRERALPLWKTTATALRAWLAIRGPVASPELFVNARGEPFSRWGVAYVLRCHTEAANRKCSTLHGKQVSPHVRRH
jgi:site-specific recombinase XerC